MNAVLIWLGAQANAALSIVGAVASNKPAPARQVLIYTIALAALAVVVPKIIKIVSK